MPAWGLSPGHEHSISLKNYLLQPDACGWGTGRSEWSWLIPPRVQVWFANRFGEPFPLMEDGSAHLPRLDAGERLFLVSDHTEFNEALRLDGNAEDWLRRSEVEGRVDSGMVLVRSL